MRRCGAGIALVAAASLAAAGDPTCARADGLPATVAMVLDTSGSLKPAEVKAARDLSLDILGGLPAGSEVALFTFDDQSRLVLERTADVEALSRALDAVKIAGRFTALHDALYDAGRYLEQAPAARKAIVLVTDGRDENSALNLDDALEVARRSGIPIVTIGTGHVEERVLRRIAKLTGGAYFPAQEAGATIVASRIPEAVVRQVAPPDVPPVSAPPSSLAGTLPATDPGGDSGSHPTGEGTEGITAGPTEAAGSATDPDGNSRRLQLMLGSVALVLGTAGLFVFAFSRRRGARCPTCDRPLAGPGALCPSCTDPAAEPPWGEGEEGGPTDAPPTIIADEFSPTVLTRMNATEEYLEKTITLREKPVLALTRGPGAGQVFSLSTDTALSIGRAKANDITLDDVAVSSQHCRIRPEGEGFVLHDLKSTNGTFVNDRRVTRHVLTDGDLIKIGETMLQFRREQTRG